MIRALREDPRRIRDGSIAVILGVLVAGCAYSPKPVPAKVEVQETETGAPANDGFYVWVYLTASPGWPNVANQVQAVRTSYTAKVADAEVFRATGEPAATGPESMAVTLKFLVPWDKLLAARTAIANAQDGRTPFSVEGEVTFSNDRTAKFKKDSKVPIRELLSQVSPRTGAAATLAGDLKLTP
jgi:hypothetical protein